VGETTKIGWCDHTFNPWHGCQRISPGCERCYAESFSKRVGLKIWGPDAPRRFFGEKHWAEPLAWDRAAHKAGERRRVFCASMADVFEDRADLVEPRSRLFDLIARTRQLDWLLLSKRPENMTRLAPASWRERWPSNVWAGATAEDNKRLAARTAHLRLVPADVRFLSCEPLLEDLDLAVHLDGIHWVIAGGESGAGARECSLAWLRNIVHDCDEANVAPFIKQAGSKPVDFCDNVPPDAGGCVPGDHDDHLVPIRLKHRKGEDQAELERYLQRQDLPEVRHA
jgi:protein gp37